MATSGSPKLSQRQGLRLLLWAQVEDAADRPQVDLRLVFSDGRGSSSNEPRGVGQDGQRLDQGPHQRHGRPLCQHPLSLARSPPAWHALFGCALSRGSSTRASRPVLGFAPRRTLCQPAEHASAPLRVIDARASSRGRRCVSVPVDRQERGVLSARGTQRPAHFVRLSANARQSPSSPLGRGGRTNNSCELIILPAAHTTLRAVKSVCFPGFSARSSPANGSQVRPQRLRPILHTDRRGAR